MTAGETGAQTLPEDVGIWGVTALLVGNAIAIPIFLLPGELAAEAGPAVLLAAILAAIPAGFVVLYNALLGSAMPVAGGLYVYMSRLTTPFWGFLVPFTIPLIAWAGLVFTGIGFAAYTAMFFEVNLTLLIYVLLVLVVIVNLLGIRVVAQVQMLFFVGLLASLALFIVPGALAVDPGNYDPFFADAGAFGVAAVALFYPFLGFGLLVELGEEIQDADRTIPIVLGIGIAVVAAIYVVLIAIMVGVMHFSALPGGETDLAVVATEFLGPWGEVAIALGALFAIVTSVNTTLLVTSRTMMRASRDGALPRWLSRIHPRFQTPHNAILFLGLPPFLLVPFLDDVTALAMFMSLGSLTAYMFCAIGLWNLPRDFPAHYENAPFRLRRYRGLLGAVLGGVVVTALYWIITLTQEPLAGVILLGWFMVGYVYYRHRLRKNGPVELYRRMTALDTHERVEE